MGGPCASLGVEAFLHEVAGAADRMVVQRTENDEAELLVERPRLKAERIEPDADKTLLARKRLCGRHQLSAVSLAAQLGGRDGGVVARYDVAFDGEVNWMRTPLEFKVSPTPLYLIKPLTADGTTGGAEAP